MYAARSALVTAAPPSVAGQMTRSGLLSRTVRSTSPGPGTVNMIGFAMDRTLPGRCVREGVLKAI